MTSLPEVRCAPRGDESDLEWAQRVCKEAGIEREVIEASFDAERRVLMVRHAPITTDTVGITVTTAPITTEYPTPICEPVRSGEKLTWTDARP